MTHYAVTAASGPFGAEAVRELQRLGIDSSQIVAIARDPSKVAAAVQVRYGDYSDPASLRTALAGVDRLLLVSGPELGLRVAQHRNVIAAAVQAGVRHLTYTSVINADRTSLRVGEDHRRTEQEVSDSGIPYTILRNSFYTENYLGRVATYVGQGEIVGAGGEGRMSAALRVDYAAAAAVVLSGDGHDGHIYELGGDSFTLGELAAAISASSGVPVRYRDVPIHALRTHLLRQGVDPAVVTLLLQVDQSIARGDLFTAGGDLARLLGRPPISLAEALVHR